MKKNCVFCDNDVINSRNAGFRSDSEQLYWLCETCHGIFLDPEYRLTSEEEKKRYTLHENTLANRGYRDHLERFMTDVLAFIEKRVAEGMASPVRTVFDYGSGPEPCLSRLFETAGFTVRYRDPYFSPDTPAFDGGADLVTCLEVAEHFAEPKRDFALMSDCVREGGFLAVGTHLLAPSVPPEHTVDSTAVLEAVWRFFAPWWYRQDATHISFYSPEALRTVAESAGFVWLGSAGENIRMFRKRRAVSR